MADQPYQSLYRRYRPQRFGEVRGQEHVSLALRNAVREDKVSHAYLFSGPRGTGKTSTARILAKALNCDRPEEGEPCGRCSSCVEIQKGASLDVHELDAASNNGVDAMRDLVARASLGTPGRSKVYIVDEVHMLSQAASNALLKTLEEPPPHVVFVLATTDPQRVLPTVRSRTQHFEFRLLGPDLLAQLLNDVRQDAGIDVSDDLLEAAVRRGNGSARDALSALDQAAAGPLSDDAASTDEVLEALADHDPARALRWLAEATNAGRDPHRTASELVERLHQGFLALMAPDLVSLPRHDRERLTEQARRLGPAAVVRAMELLGRTQVDLREAVDPKVALEVALVRLTRPDLDSSVAALEERVERLERRLSTAPEGSAPRPVPGEPSQAREHVPPTASRPERSAGGPATRAEATGETALGPPPPAGAPPGEAPSLGAFRSRSRDPEPGPQAPAGGRWPTREELVLAWGDRVLGALRGRAKAVYPSGRFLSAEGGVAVFALPDDALRSYCEACRSDVEAVLSAHLGVPMRLKLVTDPGPAAPSPDTAPDEPFGSFEEAGQPLRVSPTERLLQVFPGAEEL